MKEDIKKELEKCEKLKEEYLNGWKRAKADFLNYKSREAERRETLINFSNKELIMKILPILDDIEKAEEELPKKLEKDAWVKGVLKIKIQLLNILRKEGVEKIESVGQEFNPLFHEAVEMVEGKDSEKVAEEVKKGYKMNGQVIRPAKVKVFRVWDSNQYPTL